MTIYEEMKAHGVAIDSHESDLYVEDTPTSRVILAGHSGFASTAKRFTNQVTGTTWIDIPFAYDPFWKNKRGR